MDGGDATYLGKEFDEEEFGHRGVEVAHVDGGFLVSVFHVGEAGHFESWKGFLDSWFQMGVSLRCAEKMKDQRLTKRRNHARLTREDAIDGLDRHQHFWS